MRQWRVGWVRRSFIVVMLLGALLMTRASLVYFDSATLPPFVIEKLPVRWESIWMRALEVHVASAIVSFPCCLLLVTRFLTKRRRAHRILGRITGLLIVALLVPSGVVLSFEAKGGSLVTLGFLLSAGIVFGSFIAGVRAARALDMAAHARFMRHVVAQMSVAVTSRAMLIAFDLAGVAPDRAYLIALWVPVLTSAFLAEYFSLRVGVLRPLKPQSLSRSLS